MAAQGEQFKCQCTSGSCLSLDCACFKRGRFCHEQCQSPGCANNEAHGSERLAAIEHLLLANPMAFTAEDTLDQDECAAICNFAMLTTSVDQEPFRVEPRETPLSKLLTPVVIRQAVKTVMSAANEELRGESAESFDERTENCVAQEFDNVLQTILAHVKQ